jgi:hypothetical protein
MRMLCRDVRHVAGKKGSEGRESTCGKQVGERCNGNVEGSEGAVGCRLWA